MFSKDTWQQRELQALVAGRMWGYTFKQIARAVCRSPSACGSRYARFHPYTRRINTQGNFKKSRNMYFSVDDPMYVDIIAHAEDNDISRTQAIRDLIQKGLNSESYGPSVRPIAHTVSSIK